MHLGFFQLSGDRYKGNQTRNENGKDHDTNDHGLDPGTVLNPVDDQFEVITQAAQVKGFLGYGTDYVLDAIEQHEIDIQAQEQKGEYRDGLPQTQLRRTHHQSGMGIRFIDYIKESVVVFHGCVLLHLPAEYLILIRVSK